MLEFEELELLSSVVGSAQALLQENLITACPILIFENKKNPIFILQKHFLFTIRSQTSDLAL